MHESSGVNLLRTLHGVKGHAGKVFGSQRSICLGNLKWSQESLTKASCRPTVGLLSGSSEVRVMQGSSEVNLFKRLYDFRYETLRIYIIELFSSRPN